jgi:hypothetical protein
LPGAAGPEGGLASVALIDAVAVRLTPTGGIRPAVRVAPAPVRLERRPARGALLTGHPPAGSRAAPAAWPAHPRGRLCAHAHDPGSNHAPAPIRAVIRVGPHAIAYARSQIRRVRRTRRVHARVPAPALNRRPRAALGTRVLRIDDLRGSPPSIEPNLDHLPVALVPARPEDAAVLILARIEQPVLEPGATALAPRRARVERRATVSASTRGLNPGCRDAAQWKPLSRVVHDHRRERGERSGEGRGGEQLD